MQSVYRDQGVSIDDKHIELIVRQMTRRGRCPEPGESEFLPGERADQKVFADTNRRLVRRARSPPRAGPGAHGITKASLATDSWLSAASFQETTWVLTEAAIESRSDSLVGLQGEHHHRQAHPGRHGPPRVPRDRDPAPRLPAHGVLLLGRGRGLGRLAGGAVGGGLGRWGPR